MPVPVKLNFINYQFDVGETPTAILSNNGFRVRATIKNFGTNPVYIGEDGTKASLVANGYPLKVDETYITESSSELYAVVDSGTEDIRIIAEEEDDSFTTPNMGGA